MGRRIATTLAAALALGAAGCGGGEDPPRPSAATEAKPVGVESAGKVMQYADCGDWRAGTRAERQATVVALRDQLTPAASKTASSPLPDDRAYALLDKSCTPAYAASLRLYKLYARAQAFAGLQR